MMVAPIQGRRPLYFGLFRKRTQLLVDFSVAGWKEVAAHEIFTVTGVVEGYFYGEITQSLTSGGAATLAHGHEAGATYYGGAIALASLIAARFVPHGAAATSAATHQYLHGTTPNHSILIGVDIGYTVGAQPMTGGKILYSFAWNPLSDDGRVVVGAGGAL
ncbi:MAG: hypothetical protein ACRD1X_12380 [Vicinamibacteria bacterium]